MTENVFIVLFRGVGGETKLPVKALAAALTEAGFRHVSTYIATGNVVLTSHLTADAVRSRVAKVAKERLGFIKAVMVLKGAEWSAIAKQNPFPQAVKEPRTLHAFVLAEKPPKAELDALQARAAAPDGLIVRGKALYLHTPAGFGRSRLPALVERTLKARTTARNWNTVVKLAEMANAVAKRLKAGE